MANVDSPFGFVPIKHLDGSEYNGQVNRYFINASQPEMFKNQLVDLGGTADSNGVPNIVPISAGTGNPILGSIVAFEADREDQGKTSNPASTAAYALVADAPDVVYEAQTTTFAAANTGTNAAVSSPGTGSSTTGNSNSQIDGATYKTTTDQIRTLRLKRIEQNEFGAFAVVECFINEHRFKGVAGV